MEKEKTWDKPKARLRLYNGGKVEARLDFASLKISEYRCSMNMITARL